VGANWPGMTGPIDHVRVGTRSVGEGTCPDYLAAKAHPALWPAERLRARKEKLDTFPLGVLNAALDEIEINGATVAQAIDRAVGETEKEGKCLHSGVLTWARTAVDRYLAGVVCYQDRDRSEIPATVPVRDYWVAREDHRFSGDRLWEMYAYGRRYESPDGSVREIRLMHYGIFDPLQPIQERQAEEQESWADRKRAERAGQEAIAAYSAAFGVSAPWPRPWSKPFQPSRVARSDTGSVRMVRVVQVGLADGKHHLVFEGTPAEAKRKYDADGAGPSLGGLRIRAAGAPSASCGPRVRRLRLSPESSGSSIPEPRRGLGRPPTAGTTGRARRRTISTGCTSLVMASTARVRSAGRRCTLGSGGRTAPRAASPARCRTSRRRRMTGLLEGGVSPGKRPGVAR
jgi:hypothetical protein